MKKRVKNKKISYFSAIILVMGSSIGAGIFYKSQAVLEGNNQSLLLSILSWVIATISVIILSISLIDITKKSDKNSNLSIVGWNKIVNNDFIYKLSKNFFIYINIPLSFFVLPLYSFLSIQQGLEVYNIAVFGTKYDWIIWLTIVIIVTSIITILGSSFLNFGNYLNQITFIFKIISILATLIVSVAFMINEKSEIHLFAIKADEIDFSQNFYSGFKLIPFGGLAISILSIFYVYDGFYSSLGIQSELKTPNKVPSILILGLSGVLVINLIMATFMSSNGKANFTEFSYFLKKHDLKWIYSTINFAMGIGVLGIVNSFFLWKPRLIEELIINKEMIFWKKFINKANKKRPIIGAIYTLIIAIPFTLLLGVIASLFYVGKGDYINLGSGMDGLYSFVDIVGNWTTLFIFGFLILAIIGDLITKWKNKEIVSKKQKSAFILQVVATIFVFLILLINFLMPVVDLVIIIYQKQFVNTTLNYDQYQKQLISAITTIMTMILICLIIFIPSIIEYKKQIKKNIYY
ncbi:amino acid permease [Mesomycoplasma lagogenitalium]|uniref:Amino acid permease n=1 Tax=Mesomycoplasma lagogenitalium TaxID=171286 RepID=A0ABY8LVA8_9BACT|nr:amino acid permease [Mesomycoplasma lagogenitalium]WGI36361.1 amino acid permease [Mesomycoplasma lagogenitalium]